MNHTIKRYSLIRAEIQFFTCTNDYFIFFFYIHRYDFKDEYFQIKFIIAIGLNLICVYVF